MLPAPSARDVLVLSQIVELVRAGTSTTRPRLEAATGLGRTVVNDRVREGVALGVLAEQEPTVSAQQRGRPSRTIRFRTEAGVVLAASLGETSLQVAVADLDGRELAHATRDIDVQDGPEPTLEVVDQLLRELLDGLPDPAPVWAVAVGVPGPVEVATGRVVESPVLPSWAGFDVRSWFHARHGVPVWVDNDVNLMALGEWESGTPQERRDLLYVKVATGIGSGLVTGGRLHRGDTGAAGDIGHVRVTDDPTARCRCGKTGCLEALAAGWSLVQTLSEHARSGASPVLAEQLARRGRVTVEDIGTAVAAGDELVRATVVRSARVTGAAIAAVVNFADPGTLVLGGGGIRYSPLFFEEFRAAVLAGTVELAARRLTVRTASLDFAEGTTGAALMAVHALFAPAALRLWLADGSPVAAAGRLQLAG